MANHNQVLYPGCKHTRFLTSVVLPALILLLVLTFTIQPTLAHSPSNMELAYDVDAQTLSVTITHSVADLDTHYVERVEIKRNGELDLSEDYTTQPTTSTFTYTYDVTARDGDVLEATAVCSLFGSITEQITVSIPTPSPVITPPTPTIIIATPSSSPTSATPSPSEPQTPLPTAPPPPSATPAPTPGFEVVFVLVGILTALYLIKRTE